MCKEANPRLDIYRAKFSSVAPRDVIRAVRGLGRPNKADSDAVDARSEMDLRWVRWGLRWLSAREVVDCGRETELGVVPFPVTTLASTSHCCIARSVR